MEANVIEGESLAPRHDAKRRSTRRVHRHHSVKRGDVLLFLTRIISLAIDPVNQ